MTAQRQLKLVDLFQSIDKDDSNTITRTELREGLKVCHVLSPVLGFPISLFFIRICIIAHLWWFGGRGLGVEESEWVFGDEDFS